MTDHHGTDLQTDDVPDAVPGPYTVLLIDDDPDFHALIAVRLRGEPDLTLVGCLDANQAVAEVVRLGPAVVLLDQSMPGRSGLEILVDLRRQEVTRHIPVIMLSGQEDPYLKALAFSHGANDYLIKLPSHIELTARLRYHASVWYNRCLRTRVEQAVHEKEAQLRLLLESTSDGIYGVDTAGYCIFINAAAVRILGYPDPAALVGTIIHDRIHHTRADGTPLPRAQCPIHTMTVTADPVFVENDIFWRADGTSFAVEYRCSPMLRDGCHVGSVTTFVDVTERRAAEYSLRRSQENLAMAQQLAHLGSWEWDLVRNELIWSDEVYRIFGLEPGEGIRPSYDLFTSMIHPHDRVRVIQAVNHALEHPRAGYDVEHRIVLADHTERIVHEFGQVVCDETSQTPVRMVGAVHDLTEKRQAETRLEIATQVFNAAISEAAQHIQMTTRIFENAVESVVITDANGLIQSVNPAFSDMTDYSEDELIGLDISAFYVTDIDIVACPSVRDAIHQNNQWHAEIMGRKKNDHATYPVSLTITAIRDPGNRIAHLAFVAHDLSEIKRSQEALHFKTYHDDLTGLPNRALFKDRLQQMLRSSQRSHGRVFVAVINIDQFKNINDSLGHTYGDQLLVQVAQRFESALRKGDTVGRFGGDEFAFIFAEISEIRDCVQVIRKLLRTTVEPFYLSEHKVFITVSCGITLYPDDGDDEEALLRNAAIAMTRSRQNKHEQYQFYTAAMGIQSSQRLILENHLRNAIDAQQLILFYQPKIDLVTDSIVGMEALIRWNFPGSGMIPPSEFIPIAEESGLITAIGEWVLRTACQQTRDWHMAGFPHLKVAVNISARQFQDRSLLHLVTQVLQETGLPAEALELEITESMMMKQVDDSIALTRNIADMGVCISLDDFGTGYSSLSYLKRFPIRYLKIDRSFVCELHENPDDAAIVSAIVSMAHKLDIAVIAEGVENVQQCQFLRQNQCDQIQGYYYSRPLPPDAFFNLLQDGSPKRCLP
jgi:diguanylate cyclase (GGDEF)-like protein/PAS domain S-box-containing protein